MTFFLQNRLSLLATFSVTILLGCKGSTMPTNGPNNKTDAHSIEKMHLTPEEARTALITLIKGEIDNMFRHGDGPKIVALLKSKERIEALRNDRVTSQDDYIFIGGWTCSLKERKFFTVIELWGGHEYEVNGRFEPNDQGRWRAALLGFAHGNARR